MRTEKGRAEGGTRYQYDFALVKRGCAQIDTEQDFSHFGTWAHPDERKVFQFVEGDTHLTLCDTDEEFVSAIRDMAAWNEKHGYNPIRIDPGCGKDGEATESRFRALGLGDLLH